MQHLKILLWISIVVCIVAGISMGAPETSHKARPIMATRVYDIQMMNADTIYHQIDDMYKKGFIITNSETFQQFDVNLNLWTTKWEVHYVKQ